MKILQKYKSYVLFQKCKINMKKVIAFTIVFVFLLSLSFVSIKISQGYEENLAYLYVKSNNESGYSDIQEAIDSANDGDTIFVYSGTYNGSIVVNKSLTIIGEDKNTTIIDSHTFGDVLTIVNDWVNISGFTIQNGQKTDWTEEEYIYINAGIRITSNHVSINQNIITNNTYGIYVENGENNKIISNHIFDNGKGIRLSGLNNTIYKNNITNNNKFFISNISNVSSFEENNYGLYLVSAYNNTITENSVSNHIGKGIMISLLSSNNSIYKNNFINNSINAFDDSNNSWDDGEFGNYWSDYTGKDKNEDKIGDTPYLIPGGENKDNCPLMEPYKEFKINKGSLYYMLILGTILAIIFLIPIAIYWYKTYLKR